MGNIKKETYMKNKKQAIKHGTHKANLKHMENRKQKLKHGNTKKLNNINTQ